MVDTSDAQQDVSIAGHPKNYLYINIGAFLHILFNQELSGGLTQLDWVIKSQAGVKLIYLSQIRSLHKALWHLPLPVNDYDHCEKNAVTNLLSFTKLQEENYIICNTSDNDVFILILILSIVFPFCCYIFVESIKFSSFSDSGSSLFYYLCVVFIIALPLILILMIVLLVVITVVVMAAVLLFIHLLYFLYLFFIDRIDFCVTYIKNTSKRR